MEQTNFPPVIPVGFVMMRLFSFWRVARAKIRHAPGRQSGHPRRADSDRYRRGDLCQGRFFELKMDHEKMKIDN